MENENIDPKTRVWKYNASIVIEFLNETLMPTKMFLKGHGVAVQPGQPISTETLVDRSILKDYEMTGDELYNLYQLFREHKPYTTPVESRYQFKMLLKKIRFYRTGWEFICTRRGREQKIYYSPVMLRSRASEKQRNDFPSPGVDVAAAEVEVKLSDLSN